MIAKRRRKVECESQLKGKFCARRQFMLFSFCPFSFSTSLCLCLCAIAVDRRISVMPARRHRRKNQKRRQKIHWKVHCMAFPSRCLTCLKTHSRIACVAAIACRRLPTFAYFFLLFCFFSCFQGDKVNLANETHWAKCRAKCIWHAICWWLFLFFPSLPFLVRVQSRQSPAE